MKFKRLILALICAAMVFGGCTAKKPSDAAEDKPAAVTTDNNKKEDKDKTEDEKTTEKSISASELPDMSGWSEVSRYTGDANGDEADENVVLMTSAGRDASGNIAWGDGQQWVLYVEDRYSTYVLFDEYVQNGQVYFEAADYYTEDGAVPKINVVVSTGAEFAVRSYAFDSKNNAYTESVIYDTKDITSGGINKKFSSIPEVK